MKSSIKKWIDLAFKLVVRMLPTCLTDFLAKHYNKLIQNKGTTLLLSLYASLLFILYYTGHVAWNALFLGSEDTHLKDKAISDLGPFGDFFGGITNPIIGAIGFIALTITISMQIKQNRETTKQNFESSFFNLLNLQNSIIDNLNFEGKKSRASFSQFLEVHCEKLYPKENYGSHVIIKKSAACVFYSTYNSNHNGVFGHYFRNLYRILKMIHDSAYSEDEKKRHARILRAQLSMDELTVLFLNCLPKVCDDGAFAQLLIHYQILEHLGIKKLNSEANKNHMHSEFIIGEKVRVSSKEVAFYLKKESTHNYNTSNFGAFGRNKSRDLLKLRICLHNAQS